MSVSNQRSCPHPNEAPVLDCQRMTADIHKKHGKSDPVGTEAGFDRKRHHGSTALGCHKIYRGFIVDIAVNHNYEVGIKITMTRKTTK